MDASYYRGASYDRLNADWSMWRLSSDQAMKFDLQPLRDRARELVIGNSTASAIPEILSENVIGKDGIILQARVENSRGALNKSVNDQIEEQWARWCEDGNCTADGQGGFVDLQKLTVETECIDGEVLLYPVRNFSNAWGFAIDSIDVDQLDQNYNVAGSDSVNAIRMGVETDAWHRALAYWLWTAHPSEPEGKTRLRYPAGDFLHVYRQRRPKATRGATWMAPFIFDLNMLGRYRDAVVTAARVAASAMGFFTQDENTVGPELPTKGQKAVPRHASPGSLWQLAPGQGFEAWKPEQPSASFKEFDNSMTRNVSVGARVSYMSASNDLSSTSFASGRIGLLAERTVFQALQRRHIRRVLTPIYREWLRMAMLKGRLRLPTERPSDYYNVIWHPRAFTFIDPSKDIDVLERSVAMGIDSLTRACAEQGRDFETVMKQRAEEIKLAEKLNVPLIIAAGRAKPIEVDTVEESEDVASGDDQEGQSPTTPPKKAAPAPKKNGNGNGSNSNGAHRRIPTLR
jgi:lambda family phage portal protein